MDAKEMAEVLEKAADLYEAGQIEWCQNEYFGVKTGFTGPVFHSACAMGSIRYALTGDVHAAYDFEEDGPAELVRMENAIAFRLTRHLGVEHVPEWNDVPGRTKQQVIDTFKTVAKDLRNGAGQ